MGKKIATKHIFVTGGVVSSLGKGLTASSLGNLLVARGLRVTMQKVDPYLNVDPGTMNPLEHGEVFVTEDGGEADLDLGHYERFLDVNLPGAADITTGKIYSNVIARERSGGYHGETVQVIPHITNEIKNEMLAMGGRDVDIVIHEIGGTVGDIESLPYLEAARQVPRDIGRENVLFVHVSLVPYIGPSGELKTKPTQHSVAALRQVGILPDAIVCRADRDIPADIKRKIAGSCDVDEDAVISCPDAASVYEIPKVLHREGLDAFVVRRLGVPFRDVDWTRWDDLLDRVRNPKEEVTIALIGKYIDLPDAYLSIFEALRAGGFANWAKVNVNLVATNSCATPADAAAALKDADGVLVTDGFSIRKSKIALEALTYARQNTIPTLGLCEGMQSMVVEAARNLAGLPSASTVALEPGTDTPIIEATLVHEAKLSDLDLDLSSAASIGVIGADKDLTMRRGAYPAVLVADSIVADIYQTTQVSERHHHGYEVNNDYNDQLEAAGLRITGTSPDGNLVEFVELDRSVHPFYVGTQANPEFGSRPTRATPLFAAFIEAALTRKLSARLPVGQES